MWGVSSTGVSCRAFSFLLSCLMVVTQITDARSMSSSTKSERPLQFGADDGSSIVLTLTGHKREGNAFGLVAALEKHRQQNDVDGVSVLVRCNAAEQGLPNASFLNATDKCSSFSVISSGQVRLGIPYVSPELGDEIDETAIGVFAVEQRVAQLDALKPLESYLDIDNKRTVFTLKEQSGKFVAGAIREVDRTAKPLSLMDSEKLGALKSANPLSGVPLIQTPEASPTGELTLAYPIEFPGTRRGFSPSVSIRYGSNTGYGPLGEGWQLEVPTITVETRWGVPVYSEAFETETYLLNGSQLVPEAGDNFVGNPADALQLQPMPHRTTNLRPRKRGQARFVLRRDNELWRVIRHGDNPRDYWWEAWAESPSGGSPRTLYFGRAPGRVPSFINDADLPQPEMAGAGSYSEGRALLRAGAQASVDQSSETKWGLAREVDGHGNTIDYFWDLNGGDPGGWHDLYLRRLLYTSNLATEETILRCRETPGAASCKRRVALYDVAFDWISPATHYVRTDSRTGGLVKRGLMLSKIKVRGRQLFDASATITPNLGAKSLAWRCSPAFLSYVFDYQPEFSTAKGQGGVSAGRMFLKSIAKVVSQNSTPFEKVAGADPRACSAFPDDLTDSKTTYTTRLDYELPTSAVAGLALPRSWTQTGTATVDGQKVLEGTAPVELAAQVRGAILGSSSATKGPLASSMLGTSKTTDLAGSLYLGINFFNAGKTNSFGVKVNSSKRTSYQESTLVIDVNGDGLLDVVGRKAGRYEATLGKLDATGTLALDADPIAIAVPPGFMGFNREPFQSTRGSAIEAHFLTSFFASYRSKSSAVQDVFVQDVNADGRPDVVGSGTVFFNTSRGGQVSFALEQDRSFVDDRDYAAISNGEATLRLKSMAEEVRNATSNASGNEPRVDVTRYWRAPFSGEVLIRGNVTYAPPREPSDLRDVPLEPDPLLSAIRRKDRRDGLYFTVELNQDRAWDQPGNMLRCFAATLGGTGQKVKLVTQAAGAGTVPVSNCLKTVRPGWPDLPAVAAFPHGAGPNDGLLVSVNAGDVVFFRTHSIDNAQDDVVQFSPQIDYVRMAELRPIGAPAPPADIVYGITDVTGSSVVAASLEFLSSNCHPMEVRLPGGFNFIFDEAKARLCDPWGRSLTRYRLTEEYDQFANGSGLFISPIDGTFHFEGALTKPATLLSGEIVARILPRPSNPTEISQQESCKPDQDGQPGQEGKEQFTRILAFGQAAISESSEAGRVTTEAFKVRRGDLVCLFLRFREPGKDKPIVWPQDLSLFRWKEDALSVRFDRKLLTLYLDRDRTDEEVDELLPPADRDARRADLSNCPATQGDSQEIALPPTTDDPFELTPPDTWPKHSSKIHYRCIVVNDRHWVTPKTIGAASRSFYAERGSATAPVQRFARRTQSIKLPASDLACRPGQTAPVGSQGNLKEYRLRLEPATLGETDQADEIEVAKKVDLERPALALRNTLVTLVDGKGSQPIQLTPFTVRKTTWPLNNVWPARIDDSDLIDFFAQSSGDLTMLPQAAGELTTQEARLLPPLSPTQPNPAKLTGFYARINTTPDNSIEGDDGVRLVRSDRIAYSLCVPDESTIEITSIVENAAGLGGARQPQTVAIAATGDCGPSLCPIASSSVHLVGAVFDGPVRKPAPYAVFDPTYTQRQAPIEPSSSRGWGELALTTEYDELEPIDLGKADPTELPTAGPPSFAAISDLPTVRTYSKLLTRYLTRIGPIGKGDAVNAVNNGLCNGPNDTPDDCKRKLFLSQMRVFPLTLSFKASAEPQLKAQSGVPAQPAESTLGPNDWIYCSENPIRRPLTTTESIAQVDNKLTTAVADHAGITTAAAPISPHLCAVGPDRGAWTSGEYLSSSRIGDKDLANVEAEYLEGRASSLDENAGGTAGPAATKVPAGPLLVRMLPKVSTTSSKGNSAQLFLGVSQMSTETNSVADVLDLNGDGFPDQIQGNKVLLTDPAGRFRCLTEGAWNIPADCPERPAAPGTVKSEFQRLSKGSTNSLSIPFLSPKTFAEATASAAGRLAGSRSGNPPAQNQTSRDPGWGMSLGLDFTKGATTRNADFMDMNGDGLPDAVTGASAGAASVSLNLGQAIGQSAAQPWNGGLITERSASVGLSASIGYGDDKQSYGGGFSAATNYSRQNAILADMNNDGLVDQISISGKTVSARINNGDGFADGSVQIATLPRDFGGLSQGETDSVTASGFFTLSPCIPVPWGCIYIVINPGASTGAVVNRQVITFRDMDGDGLSDLAVAGGINVAGDLSLMFSNSDAKIYKNPFARHGVLSAVYLPTNPDASKGVLPPGAIANYRFGYSLVAASWNDPNTRRVFSKLEVWDGVQADNVMPNQRRRTCYGYSGGYFDRFERTFLGYSKVVSVDGCDEPLTDAPIGMVSAEGLAVLPGIRRTARTYANRSIYESGLLLSEHTIDLATPVVSSIQKGGERTTENTYVLVDIGVSTARHFGCQMLNVASGAAGGDASMKPVMRAMLEMSEGKPGRIAFPSPANDDQEAGQCEPVPVLEFESTAAFDPPSPRDPRESRRLAPVLVQTVQSTTEGGDLKLISALQYGVDHYGRIVEMCNLGDLTDRADDLCSNIEYDSSIQLSFIHGATGGGTLAYDLKNRVRAVVVDSADPAGKPLRRRTASYSREFGDLLAVCAFEDVSASADPCEGEAFIPPLASELDINRLSRVAVSNYQYDQYGNIERYASPLSADGYFVVKSYTYDDVVRYAEVSEETEYCKLDKEVPPRDRAVTTNGQGSKCPMGTASTEGVFRSTFSDFDWRHAIATTQCDVNRNGMTTEYDNTGRPTRVSVSWAGPEGDSVQPGAKAKCTADGKKPSDAVWSSIAEYQYRVGLEVVGASHEANTAVSRVTRFVSARNYKYAGVEKPGSGLLALVSDTHFDHLGIAINTISPADVCIPGEESDEGASCDPSLRKKYAAGPLIRRDNLDRETEIFLPTPHDDLPPIHEARLPDGPASQEKASIVYDGFDRPLHVQLSDGNGYAFRYLVVDVDGKLRHRSVSRDARCVPHAIDRDVRGNVVSVSEYFHRSLGEKDFGKHALGSSGNPEDDAVIKLLSWVKTIAYDGDDRDQQRVGCEQGEVSDTVAAGQSLIAAPLRDLESEIGGPLARSRTAYRYDELSQLVSVALPAETATTSGASSGSSIDVAYDGLGRRTLISDPDRGVERLSYDLASNVICRRTTEPVSKPENLVELLSEFDVERARRVEGGTRLAGEDLCLAPLVQNSKIIARTIRNEYQFDRLANVLYVDPVSVDGDLKNAAYIYGKASNDNDVRDNRAGRIIEITDATGRHATPRYHALGMPEQTKRTLYGLVRSDPAADPPPVMGTVQTASLFDNWGLLRRTALQGEFSGLAEGGTADRDLSNVLTAAQATWYRYSPAGPVAEILAGSPCKLPVDATDDWPANTPECSEQFRPLRIVADTSFDERGNAVRIAYGNGVVTRNTFSHPTNRMMRSSSRIGVRCDEEASDDCSGQAPPIEFQNLAYRYDAAGQVVGYDNLPRDIFPCLPISSLPACSPLSKANAVAYGLLVSGSTNNFAYDEIGRLKSADKVLGTFNKSADELTLTAEAAAEAPLSFIKFKEEFRFTDSHLLTGLRRTLQMGDSEAPGVPATDFNDYGPELTTEIRHEYSHGGPHAVDLTTVKKPEAPFKEEMAYVHDAAGRLELTRCAGCLAKPARGEKRYVANEYGWDPDDTLVSTHRRVDPPKAGKHKGSGGQRNFIYTEQTYDYAGERVLKRAQEKIGQFKKTAVGKNLVETIYADARLTVTRKPGEKPDALYHVLAGSRRIATKWADGNGLFIYHAQMPTRSISDIVYSNGDDPATARIHKQMEYAPFGEILVGREMPVAGDANGRNGLARPLYRFNAKEYDEESGLTYFGARHYDQRMALWLSPDPILGAYLSGDINDGVFNSRNLAAYGFGWGNPINYLDIDGMAPGTPDGFVIVGAMGGVAGVVVGGAGGVVLSIPTFGAAAPITVSLGAGSLGLLGTATGGLIGTTIDRIEDATGLSLLPSWPQPVMPTWVESRSKAPSPLPEAKGSDHSILQPDGGYTTWEGNRSKQFRPSGKPHGDIPRPNVKEHTEHVGPGGKSLRPEVRSPRADEIRPEGGYRPANDNSPKGGSPE